MSRQLDWCLPADADPGDRVAGTDEAGRGPLAGDVVAAAVILDSQRGIPGLRDSKALSARQRSLLFDQIQAQSLAWAVARASVEEIDRLNILQASLLAMTRAVEALPVAPTLVYVDGNRCPSWSYRSVAVVGGDDRLYCIAAASILAKVTRDRDMEALEQRYPGYGFAQHKGYGTAAHLQALAALGPCPAHRRSFGPVARLVNT